MLLHPLIDHSVLQLLFSSHSKFNLIELRWSYLQNTSRIWPHLVTVTSETVIHASITSQLIYCYKLLQFSLLRPLQPVLSVAASDPSNKGHFMSLLCSEPWIKTSPCNGPTWAALSFSKPVSYFSIPHLLDSSHSDPIVIIPTEWECCGPRP